MTHADDKADLERLAPAIKEKYAQERAKRLREDASDQYLDIKELYSDGFPDPFVKPGFSRAAVTETVEVLIVGGGFGGLMAALRLRQAGIDNIRIIEKGGDFGGTWYWNRYPGAACDIQSYLYFPILEEMEYIPTEKYAKATEIFAYAQMMGRKFELYERTFFQTEVKGAAWDASARRWRAETDRADHLEARFLLLAGGILHKPKLPGISGIDTFKGVSFHTTRWNYAYTGGSPSEPMDKLRDKRVGIIGTGATAIQAIPKLGEAAKELYVFQRTPSAVRTRDNGPTDPVWAASLESGWQTLQMDNFAAWTTGRPDGEDMTRDSWTRLVDFAAVRSATTPDEARRAAELSDLREMETVRARVDAVVKDSATAEALKPWYKQLCKRPCFHDEYLETFNLPSVKLVDTGGKGVERVTPDGVVVGNVEYPVDCLIYASGFEISTSFTSRMGFDVLGRGGVSLNDQWNANPETLHGVLTCGFPNLLVFSTTQGGQGINYVHVLADLGEHVAYIVSRCKRLGIETVEPSQTVAKEWWNVVLNSFLALAEYQADCTPGYYNNEGSRDPSGIKKVPFMGNATEFGQILKRWRDSDDFAGLEVTCVKTAPA